MVVNNSMFVPKNIAPAFQPAQQIMKMVSTINNNLAIRQDSFAKSTELEKQMRMMLLTEDNETPAPRLVQEGDFAAFMAKSPIESRLETINKTTDIIAEAKGLVSVIQKHEAILADESTPQEQRVISTKLNQSLKKLLESRITLTIEVTSAFSDRPGAMYDRHNNTGQFAKLVELTGDLSAKGLGLTGFANMNSAEILEKLDGALAHLNEMGKLVNPAYTPPEIAPVPQKELDRFERIAESWDYITGKQVHGEPKEPMPKTTLNIYA